MFSVYITVYILYSCTIEWCTSPLSQCSPCISQCTYCTGVGWYGVDLHHHCVLCVYHSVHIVQVYRGMVYISIISLLSLYITVYLLYRCTTVWCISPSSQCSLWSTTSTRCWSSRLFYKRQGTMNNLLDTQLFK